MTFEQRLRDLVITVISLVLFIAAVPYLMRLAIYLSDVASVTPPIAIGGERRQP
jgi:hypothetical protein